MQADIAEIFSDGSCHTQLKIGGWAAILFIDQEKIILSGTALNTTHNQMELTAVIKSIEYIRTNYPMLKGIRICSDSQYVTGLPARKENLTANKFVTQNGNSMQNAELVQTLLKQVESFNVEWIKIKAHQKRNETANPNIEVDKLSRRIVREAVKGRVTIGNRQ